MLRPLRTVAVDVEALGLREEFGQVVGHGGGDHHPLAGGDVMACEFEGVGGGADEQRGYRIHPHGFQRCAVHRIHLAQALAPGPGAGEERFRLLPHPLQHVRVPQQCVEHEGAGARHGVQRRDEGAHRRDLEVRFGKKLRIGVVQVKQVVDQVRLGAVPLPHRARVALDHLVIELVHLRLRRGGSAATSAG